MGGGPIAEKEYVLIVAPFQEPVEAVDWIRGKHPNAEFKFIRQQVIPNDWSSMGPTVIPDGMFPDYV